MCQEKNCGIKNYSSNLCHYHYFHNYYNTHKYRYVVKDKEKRNKLRRKFHLEHKKLHNLKRKEKRHRLGISKKYREEYNDRSKTIEYKRNYRRLWKQTPQGQLSQKKHNAIHRSKIKDLSIKTIQLVYEDNIRKYGTLTCYLCLRQIKFGNDHLEHKIPLSRGG